MRTTLRALFLTGVLGLAACGGKTPPAGPPPEESPLTVEEWRRIPEPHVKYDPETFERLKKGIPRLQTPRGWAAFYESEVRSRRP